MRRRWVVATGLAACLLLVATACASKPIEQPSPSSDEAPTEPVTEADYEAASFTNPSAVDNTWQPLVPGTQLVYEGKVNDGKDRVAHRVVSTVTDLTKVIDGVETVVVWDRDFTSGELVEAEIAFFGQDDAGNIWLMGEHPEEYEEGKFAAAPTWIHGIAGAEAGVFMRADPQMDTPDYAHGLAPEVEFTDRATVRSTGMRNCVPQGCFDDVLVIDEYNPDEPGKHQLKFYAPGVGNIRVGWAGAKETDKEVLILVEIRQLDDSALAEARQAALALDANAYEVSPDLYGDTEPLRTPSYAGY